MIGEHTAQRRAAPPGASSSARRADQLEVGDLELDPVTSHGWRVADRSRALHDPFRLLAFIEQRGDVFEVMQLGAGFEWHEFDSLLAAVAYVVETSPVVTCKRMGGGSWLV